MARSALSVSSALNKVPPFPPAAAKLLHSLTNPAVDCGQVAELVSSDATFTARVLQRANSAEFGLHAPVTSIRQAIALLRLDLTRQVVIVQAYLEAALGTEQLRRCWEHTVATAVLAEEVAQPCQVHTQSAFTSGIMHDIARLGLLVAYEDDYERIIRDAAERYLDLLDFEQQEFGIVAGRHHDPSDGAVLDRLQILHVACRLADALGYDVVRPRQPMDKKDVLAELPVKARERLRNNPAELRDRIQEQISRYSSAEEAPASGVTLALLAPVEPQTGESSATAPVRSIGPNSPGRACSRLTGGQKNPVRPALGRRRSADIGSGSAGRHPALEAGRL